MDDADWDRIRKSLRYPLECNVAAIMKSLDCDVVYAALAAIVAGEFLVAYELLEPAMKVAVDTAAQVGAVTYEDTFTRSDLVWFIVVDLACVTSATGPILSALPFDAIHAVSTYLDRVGDLKPLVDEDTH